MAIIEPEEGAVGTVGEVTAISIRSSNSAMPEPLLRIIVGEPDGTSSSDNAAEGYATELTYAWSPRMAGTHEIYGQAFDTCLFEGDGKPRIATRVYDSRLIEIVE